MSESLRRSPELREEESDAHALERVERGELSALGVVYDRHYVAILRFAQRMTRDTADAEDIAQETFLTAARIASTYDGRRPCRSWLYGIAARLVMHRGRGRARMMRFLGKLTLQPTAQASIPDLAVEQRQLGDEIEHALTKLSPEKRVVLVLAEVEGLTCEEIATALAVPIGTVWTRLHHARLALRARLSRSAP